MVKRKGSWFDGRKIKEFNNYDKARKFCDEVDGLIQWTSYKRESLWYVWY